MEPLHLPSEEEINAAYNKGKEAVVALFYETFLKMAERPPRSDRGEVEERLLQVSLRGTKQSPRVGRDCFVGKSASRQ